MIGIMYLFRDVFFLIIADEFSATFRYLHHALFSSIFTNKNVEKVNF